MKKITTKQIIEDLKELFEINNYSKEEGFRNFCIEGQNFIPAKFLIDKRKFERLQVIDMLQNYFSDKVIDGGYVEISPITFVHTEFEIKNGHPIRQ